ncbi:hypothetical protein FHT10_000139 [Xanthomonas arboricola]|nr:hypothetical protein [Xanthomonas cannabis]
MWCAKTAVLDFWRSIRRVARAAAAPAAPIRPSGTFPRRRGKGGVCRQGKQALVERRCSAGNPLPSPAGGRRWRAAPDEGRLVPCESYLREYRQTAAPIRPSGTFPRRRGKGGIYRRGREAFAGRGSRRWCNAAAALATRCLLPRAGEGGAQRRMRGGWCRASHACGNIARVLPPSALRAPSPACGGREALAGGEGRRWCNVAAALATGCLLPRAGEGGAQRRMRGVGL